jgi:hypothetical protein
MPRYEPRHISTSATITWRSHLLVTRISSSTVSSVAAEMKVSSRAHRALLACWQRNLRLTLCRAKQPKVPPAEQVERQTRGTGR